jgi:23S rRNA (adenine2503-C2)-methyltransferase
MATRYSVTFDQLAALLAGWGEPAYRARQVWDGLYRQHAPIETLTALPRALRDRLDAELPYALTTVVESTGERGSTTKWLWSTAGNAQVETVLMRYPKRATVCVSSQAGCAMACVFCATGQAGFDRHLDAGEIVEQVVRAAQHTTARVSNVVFMGMGEPLANYDPVWEATERIHTDLGLSARHITISTVGIVPGMRRLAAEQLPVTLAVSLHAPNDELRNELVPINRRYPLDDVIDAAADYLARKGRRITFEYAMIGGVNDSLALADELAGLVRPVHPHVNLIPLNPTQGLSAHATPPDELEDFADRLRDRGVNATIRRNRGTDIDAACGQLRFRSLEEAALEKAPLEDGGREPRGRESVAPAAGGAE